MSRLTLLACLALLAVPAAARAQVDRQLAEEPTGGVRLPVTPLAGSHDARATVVNPAGLGFLGGSELALAIDVADEDHATTAGPGVGVFWAGRLGAGGIGLGIEWLRPSRVRLAPDPGTPWRTTVASSLPLGRRAQLGFAWHHFGDDGALGGVDTWDVGLSWRLGNRLALGAVVRDLATPRVAGDAVERRYEAEATVRPLATDQLEVGLGGRIVEADGDLDGWARASARVVRGLYLHAGLETRALEVIETTPSGEDRRDARDLVATLGLEVSFGAAGVTTYGAGGLDEDGDARAFGGTVVARLSTQHVPPVQGRARRIERIDLRGALGARAHARLVLRLRAIARDPDVAGVVLAIDGLASGWATVQELRQAALAVRAAGKKVFAYLVTGSSRDYYLASAADKIYVDPAGGLRLTGMAATTLYFKGAFDDLGVSAQFEKIAEYKSAPESYTDTGPSEPARRMRDELYDSMYDELVAAIAAGRGLDRAAVEAIVQTGPYDAGELAADKRLVDAVGTPDEISQLISVEVGGKFVVGAAADERDDRWERPAIAVIYADGDIVDGASQDIPLIGRKLVGGETMVAALAAARLDPAIKAVVIRIDSPGGSALASELMSREVFKTRGVKPIVCSMGDVAASGGYFLAAGCERIFADPMTVTGSIGIFYGKFDLSGLLAKLGIGAVTFTRGEHADMDSYYRPYTDEERAIIQDKLRYLYGRFTGAVALGRGMSEAAVDEVGRGRVWSGKQALAVGLVDELGGLVDAIDHAKIQAGLGADARVRIVELPRPGGGLLGALLDAVVGVAAHARGAERASVDLGLSGLVGHALRGIPASLLVSPGSAQARLPFELIWE